MEFNDKILKGGWAEAVATARLFEVGYMVFNNVMSSGPVDLIAVHPEYGVYALDIKVDGTRRVKHASGNYSRRKHRIHRVLKPLQRHLRVRIGYVTPEYKLEVVPPLPGFRKHKQKPVAVKIHNRKE